MQSTTSENYIRSIIHSSIITTLLCCHVSSVILLWTEEKKISSYCCTPWVMVWLTMFREIWPLDKHCCQRLKSLMIFVLFILGTAKVLNSCDLDCLCVHTCSRVLWCTLVYNGVHNVTCPGGQQRFWEQIHKIFY